MSEESGLTWEFEVCEDEYAVFEADFVFRVWEMEPNFKKCVLAIPCISALVASLCRPCTRLSISPSLAVQSSLGKSYFSRCSSYWMAMLHLHLISPMFSLVDIQNRVWIGMGEPKPGFPKAAGEIRLHDGITRWSGNANDETRKWYNWRGGAVSKPWQRDAMLSYR